MMIKNIELKNIRSYKEAKINFPDNGSILLAGDIGCGKSSLLLGIDFALFGLRPDLPAGALLRHGESRGAVTLEFEVDGKNVKIERNLERKNSSTGQSSGFIHVNGAKEELTPTEIKSQILGLLGYPEKLLKKNKSLLYRYTVYTPQEQMKEILFAKSEERLDTLRHMFGVDKYKQISENSKILSKEVRATAKEKMGLSHDLDQKKTIFKKIEQELSSLGERSKKLGAELTVLINKKIEIENRKKQFEEKIELSRQLQNKISLKMVEIQSEKKAIDNLHNELELMGNKIKRLQSALQDNPEKTLHDAENELRKAQHELKAADESKVRIQVELDRFKPLRQKISDVGALLHSKEQQVDDLFRECKDLESNITELQVKYEFPEAKIANLKKDIERMPLIMEKKKYAEKQLEGIRKEIALLENGISNSKIILEKLTKESTCPLCQQKVTTSHRGTVELKESEKIKHSGMQIQKHQFAISELDKEASQLEKEENVLRRKEKEILEVQNNFEEIKRLKYDLENKRKKIEEMKKDIRKIKEEQSELKLMSEKLDKTEQSFYEVDKRLSGLNVSVRSFSDRVSLLKRDMQEYNTLIHEQLEKFKKLESSQQHMKSLENEKWHIGKELEQFAGIVEQVGNIVNELDTASNELSSTKEELVRINQKVADASGEISNLAEEIGMKEIARKGASRLNDINNWLNDSFIPLMGIIEKHVMVKIQQDFNLLFREWFSNLIDDSNLTARIDASFEPIIEQNGYQTSFEHLSGGEKTSVALAYRLALNKIVNSLSETIRTKDLLILDEPTDGFSSEQLDKVRNVLDELNLKQIILVSHEEKVESFVDHIIRFKKENGVSKVMQSS